MGFDSNQTPQNTETYLTFVLSVRASHLWTAPYSTYQQFLYDTITDLREKGWNYRQIADWLNQNDYRTPRGKMFHGSLPTFHLQEEKDWQRATEPEVYLRTVEIDL